MVWIFGWSLSEERMRLHGGRNSPNLFKYGFRPRERGLILCREKEHSLEATEVLGCFSRTEKISLALGA